MTTLELYTKGARVWIPHADLVWEGAELQHDYTADRRELRVLSDAGLEHTLTIKSDKDLPFLRNPTILIGENDLTSLSYLHEPAVLYNLQVRFCQRRDIYTYCGIVLVAVNPYDELDIYGIDTIQTYRGQSMGDLDPHIFAVAEEAYTKLEQEQRDQSIIVSGESGAGKTVSAKYAMRYFATVGGNATETQVEKKVLASSPIMEAIGNAKTTRNDNSSRFGKFIELQFNKQFNISGASMRTYLLEKSRVVFQAPEERNYHIFYQLCAAHKQLPDLNLDNAGTFHYLNQGCSLSVDGVNDLKAFDETVTALNLLGFSEKEQTYMFKIYAAILHLGNIEFEDTIISRENEQDEEGVEIKASNTNLKHFCRLLGIDSDQIRRWLCIRKLVSMRDVFLKPMSRDQATVSRDALAKRIYATLFDWIVRVINEALASDVPRHKCIGVLDIYGFETFETNSFEQFCINYANEKLQQQFNQHVFKLEQEEYIKEGIEWKMIDFYDNQPCIDLIEAKLGVLDLLDEECRMPKGTDASWTEKLYDKCKKYSQFSKARFGSSAFKVVHFADIVQYESIGFLEKNRDTVIEEQIAVIRNGENKLMRKLFSNKDQLEPPTTQKVKLKVVSAKPVSSAQRTQTKTVSSQFRDSLSRLMATLNATTPHYVRCIKPNDDKSCFEYNPQRAVQQLRACGVLETIRISAAGFPSRWCYIDFFYRYRVLCKFKDINRQNMQQTCERILRQHIRNSDMYQFGRSKIFCRAGQVAYLEKLRAEKLRQCCVIVQKTIRMFVCRRRYLRITKMVYGLQRHSRGYLARRLAVKIRRNRAAIKIQKHIRGWLKRTQYRKQQYLVLGLQRRARGVLARRKFMQLKYNAKALIIQKHVRGWIARKQFAKRQHNIVLCQSVIRRFLARRKYKKLRIEARSIEHVKKLNKGLENKIFMMQQRIEDLNKHKSDLTVAQKDIGELKTKLTTFKALELEVKNLNILLMEKNHTISTLEETVRAERDEKVDLINEHDRYRKETDAEQKHWTEETAKLRKELDNMNEIVRANEQGAQDALTQQFEHERKVMISEQDNERAVYQTLLEKYNQMEQHCEYLEQQLGGSAGGIGDNGLVRHVRNISDVSSVLTIDEQLLSITTDLPEDGGYSSVRSAASSTHGKLDTIEWKTGEHSSTPDTSLITTHTSPSSKTSPPPPPPPTTLSTSASNHQQPEDVSLVLTLHRRISDLRREVTRLQQRLDAAAKQSSPRTESAEMAARDAIRAGELELLNANLSAQLSELRRAVDDKGRGAVLAEQAYKLQEEIERRSEEVVQLKCVLSQQSVTGMSTGTRGRMGEYINEDGELSLAYDTQKTINKQLELELQDEKAKYKAHEKELLGMIDRLQTDNDRQHQILTTGLQQQQQVGGASIVKSQNEVYLQHEITRFATENVELQDNVDSLNVAVRKLKTQVKLLTKKLKEAGLDLDDTMQAELATDLQRYKQSSTGKLPTPSIRKKDREYLGMFTFQEGDESAIMRILITELKPRVAVPLLPGLPAYIMFMCVRHTDYINDEVKVRTLMSAFCNTVKKVIRKRLDDLETIVLWFSNTIRLFNNMKQYSGDKIFQEKNSPKMNDQCLRNFDLSEYRSLLQEIAIWIYQALIRKLEEKIQPLIVPAILEHEEIPGMSGAGNKPTGMRKRTNSMAAMKTDPTTPTTPTSGAAKQQKPIDALVQELRNNHKILQFYGVDNEVMSQVFRQLYYFVCASSLNNLLLRKELCHWSKGFQIRHNLSHLEMWTREKELDDASIQETLHPIIQAAHLLQARKTEEDVASICEMCCSLNTLQICKILNLYTPVDDFEVRVPMSFVNKVKAKLEERSETNQTLLMDIKQNYPVRFPFKPSPICLEDIEIPDVLKLPMLTKL